MSHVNAILASDETRVAAFPADHPKRREGGFARIDLIGAGFDVSLAGNCEAQISVNAIGAQVLISPHPRESLTLCDLSIDDRLVS
jgi:hypothetical protein